MGVALLADPVLHDAVVHLIVSIIYIHKSTTVTTRVARVPLTFLPQHFTESLSTLCVSSLYKHLQ